MLCVHYTSTVLRNEAHVFMTIAILFCLPCFIAHPQESADSFALPRWVPQLHAACKLRTMLCASPQASSTSTPNSLTCSHRATITLFGLARLLWNSMHYHAVCNLRRTEPTQTSSRSSCCLRVKKPGAHTYRAKHPRRLGSVKAPGTTRDWAEGRVSASYTLPNI